MKGSGRGLEEKGSGRGLEEKGSEMSVWRSAWYNLESSKYVIIYRLVCRNGALLEGREGETVQVRRTYTQYTNTHSWV